MADAAAMKKSAMVANAQCSSIVVVSATFGTTDQLLGIIESASSGDWGASEKLIFTVREKHFDIHYAIGKDEETAQILKSLLAELETLAKGIFLLGEKSPKAVDQILSIGERLSSALFVQLNKSLFPKKTYKLFDARELIVTDDRHGKARPLVLETSLKARPAQQLLEENVLVTQGFIGMSEEGHTTTLGRGGSDYSAALIAEAIEADALEIWTDVPGLATTDPKISPNAQAIAEITYEEAQEMARYGAKILHPTTLLPAMRHRIPVFVGSSQDGSAKGTWIRPEAKEMPLVRAVTLKKGQKLLTLRSLDLADGARILSEAFKAIEEAQASVDCVTTSETSLAISLEGHFLEDKKLTKRLDAIGSIKIEEDYTLLSLIGNGIHSTPMLAQKLFTALDDINVRMMCLGASSHNFNLLVKSELGDEAARRLHNAFIKEKK